MKYAILIFAVAVAGCSTPKPLAEPPSVSTATLGHNLTETSQAVDEAQTATTSAAGGVTAARSYSQRIDDKAVVILNAWDSAR